VLPRVRRLLVRLTIVAVVFYVGTIGVILALETKLVYPGVMSSRVRPVPDSSAGFAWDSLRVQSADRTPVWFLVAKAADTTPRPWALFFHGNAGQTGSGGSVARYRMLLQAGFNVVAMEFRGFGISKSAGSPTARNLAEDAAAVWSHMTSHLGATPTRTVFYGWSLGGGVAADLAASVRPAALITEGAFTSVPAMGRVRYPWLPPIPVVRNKFDNLAHARTLDLPWLVLHGRADDIVPFTQGEQLAAAARNARLVPLNADHNDGVDADREVALAALRQVAAQLSR
jgi:pimeloyl-ACP methyl ester carboxylesterase